MSLRSVASGVLKALSRMVFGRQGAWWGRLLPRSGRDYSRDVGDGMSSSVIVAPVMWIARTYPEAPLCVERRGEIVPDHPMAELIRNPNPYYSGHVMQMATLIDVVLKGDGYWLKVRNRTRAPIELWYAPWWMMSPKAPDDGSAYISHYEYSPLGLPIRVEVEDVVHLRYGLDPRNIRCGLGQLTPLLREVFTDDEAAAFTATILGNAGVPGLVVSPAESGASVTEVDKQDTKEYFKKAFGGESRGEPLVMTGPTRVEQFGFSPQQLDLAKLREIPEERVCAVLGIPAAVVGFGSGLAQTKVGATMSEMREMAYESCIIPLQRLIASDLDRQLLPDFETDSTARTVYDLSDVRVLQEDQNRLAMRLDTMVRGGWVTVAEARRDMRYEVLPEHEIYLRSFSSIVVPAGRSPEEQEAGEVESDEPPAEPVADEQPPAEGKAHMPVKASSRERQAYAIRQLREARKLTGTFAGELSAQFRILGEHAAGLWRDALAHTFPGAKAAGLKELTADQVQLLVSQVQERLDLTGFDFGPHYIRTAVSTFEGLNTAFGMGFNLSEPLEATLIREGGRRLGLVDMSQQATESLMDAIAEGRSLGHGPAELALDIRDTIARGPWSSPDIRAEVIARTETKHAQNYASIEAYKASDTITMIEIVDGQISTSCEPCRARDGQVVTFEEAERIMAEEHPNGTLSLTPVIGAQR